MVEIGRLTLQLEQLAPTTASGTSWYVRSESRSCGEDVPLKAMTTSLALVSRNRVAWVSVAASLNVLTMVVPLGGCGQSSEYEAAANAVYRAILSNTPEDTADDVSWDS